MNKELLENVLNNLKNGNKENLFKTGFTELDSLLTEVDKGQIIVIGGRPAMGKTSFALSICLNLLKEKRKICYFSLKMEKEKLLKRLLHTELKETKINFEDEKEANKLSNTIKFLENAKLFIEDKTIISTEEVEEKIKEINPDIVFIDYVQLLKMKKAPNLTEATNLAIHEIKRIAMENNTIIILLSQLSRSVEARVDKYPLFSDLRNGSLLEEISDVILFIYRESYYDRESTLKNSAEIIVAKNHFGPTSSICLDYNAPFFKNPSYSDNLIRIF